MDAISLPFNPLRNSLYTSNELFAGFASNDPDSLARAPDITILSYFVRYGKNPTSDSRASTLEALHDNSISTAMQSILKRSAKVVAVMGGHGINRGTDPYIDIAYLARELTARGFLMASGGGPGAMEATHLGASFSQRADKDLRDAIELLSKQTALPSNAAKLVASDGGIDREIAIRLHEWLSPAIAIARDLGKDASASLAVPTWLYGFEPTTPFATHIAKYFQNSLREDGLVTLATHGVVYAEGKAGTVQEIFQDATQNYYGDFFPMVFLSAKVMPPRNYWKETLPVEPLLKALFKETPDYATRVLFTDSIETAVHFLTDPGSAQLENGGASRRT